MRAASGGSTLELEDGQTALENRLTRAHRRGRRRVCISGRSRNDQVLDGAAALSARRRRRTLARGAESCRRRRSTAWRSAQGAIALPGYTHMQQAMPSSCRAVGRRLCGRAARRCRRGSRHAHAAHRARTRSARPPATARPNLPLDRELTRAALGFAEIHEPVTAVQLSRGKAEAQRAVRDRAADAGPGPARLRPAALLYAGIRLRRRCRTRSRPARRSCRRSATPTCSSWCAAARRRRRPASPKCSASPPSCRRATSATCSSSRRRCSARIDLCRASLAIMAAAIDGVRFRAGAHPPRRRTSTPPRKRTRWSSREGIPFREAYRRIAASDADLSRHGVSGLPDCPTASDYRVRNNRNDLRCRARYIYVRV